MSKLYLTYRDDMIKGIKEDIKTLNKETFKLNNLMYHTLEFSKNDMIDFNSKFSDNVLTKYLNLNIDNV